MFTNNIFSTFNWRLAFVRRQCFFFILIVIVKFGNQLLLKCVKILKCWYNAEMWTLKPNVFKHRPCVRERNMNCVIRRQTIHWFPRLTANEGDTLWGMCYQKYVKNWRNGGKEEITLEPERRLSPNTPAMFTLIISNSFICGYNYPT